MFNNASANVKEGPPSPPSSAPPYTLLTKRQRQWLALLIGIATMFSPLTANIYLPCVPLLKEDFHTTLQLINMTITAYILVQGIAPTFFSQLSEKLGRRPVYILTFSIFVLSSLALSLQHSYNALLILRMVQSLGASVSTSMGYAVIADVSAPSERGKMIAPVMLTVNLGPILAPVIGGPLCGRTNWRWIFRLLTILGAAFLTVVILFLPETNRKIVGNGRIEGRGINKPLLPFLIPKASQYEQRPKAAKNPGRLAKAKAIMPNPFKSVALVFQKDTFHVLYLAGSFYMMYYVSQASLPSLLKEVYGFDETKIGLCYFTLSVGIVISSQIQARMMDWNYKVTAKKIGWEIDLHAGDNISSFPIERARARLAWLWSIIQCGSIIGYGWAVQNRVHVSVPLILQFLQGTFGWFFTWNTLLVELHPNSTSTASAAGNLTRCLLAASGVAVMEPLMNAMGIGPFFTLLGGFVLLTSFMSMFLVRKYGMEWRQRREEHEA